MKTGHRERIRQALYARFIRRNKRRTLNVRQLEELNEARKIARLAAGRSALNPGSIPRIELAPQTKIQDLRPQIWILLKAFGHLEALVTDESLVRDMLPDGRKLVAIRRKLKIPIAANDYIFAVAERMLARGKGRE